MPISEVTASVPFLFGMLIVQLPVMGTWRSIAFAPVMLSKSRIDVAEVVGVIQKPPFDTKCGLIRGALRSRAACRSVWSERVPVIEPHTAAPPPPEPPRKPPRLRKLTRSVTSLIS